MIGVRPHAGRARLVTIGLVAIGLVAMSGWIGMRPARAQVPLPIAPHQLPIGSHEPPPPYCQSDVRYFGVGSVTVEYRLERTVGPLHYRVPPHALPLIGAHTGTMRGTVFFQSQYWQIGRILGRAACRSLTHRRPVVREVITDEHGRRVGMIIAKLIPSGSGTTP